MILLIVSCDSSVPIVELCTTLTASEAGVASCEVREEWPMRRVVPILFVVVAACGGVSGDGRTRVVTTGESLAGVVPGVVVSGEDVGWVVARADASETSNVWRVDASGAATHGTTLPGFFAPVGTYFAENVVVGGVRCAVPEPACNETHAELVALDPEGEVKTRTVVDEHDGPPASSDSIAIVGAAADRLWVAGFDGDLVAIGTDRRVTERIDAPRGEPCVVDGELIVATSASAAQETSGSYVSPTGPSVDPTLTLHRWTGGAWEIAAAEGPGSSGDAHCSPAGMEVRSGDADPTAIWSADDGWEVNSASNQRPTGATAFSATNREYVLATDGRLHVRRPEGWEATAISFPRQPADQAPMALWVDDSGPSLFACIGSARTGTICSLVATPA